MNALHDRTARPMRAGAPPWPLPTLLQSEQMTSSATGDVTVRLLTPPLPLPAPDAPIVNAPISWGQWWGSILSEYTAPEVVLALLGSLSLWLSGGGTLTMRAIVQAVIVALIAAAQAAKAISGNGALQLRLRAMGQITK